VTKQELIKRIATTPGVALNQRSVATLVDAVFTNIAEYFVEARVSKRKAARFSYPGFGTFTKKRKSSRSVRNPQTGEFLTIPETTTLVFAPGQELKAHLNGGARKRRAG
jgi:nucleoid DNA-binding protein